MKKGTISLCMALFVVTLGFSTGKGEGGGGTADLQGFAGQSGTINIAGGTAHIPVMQEAAKRIMQFNPNINITIAGGGSGVGVKQVGEGLVQIGNTGRALTDSEIASYGLVSYPFAIDGVALAVHPSNGVGALSSKQVQDIFSGAVKNWKEVGGKDAAITLYTREDGSGTREVFVDILLKKGKIAPNAVVVNSNGAMKTAIAKDANGAGYIGIGYIDAGVKALDIDGMKPTQANASSGAYTITRLLYMNTKGAPDKLSETFIKYITDSADGKSIISDAGYIPLK
jgi:phosphate transport system substrate-binding protein